MDPNDDLSSEMQHILLDVLDNKASDTDFARLVELLRESEELREQACLYLCDETLIAEEMGTAQQKSQLAEIIAQNLPAATPHSHRSHSAKRSSLRHRILDYVNDHGLAVAAMACLIVFGLLAQNLLMMEKFSRLHSTVVKGAKQGEVEVIVGTESNKHHKLGQHGEQPNIGNRPALLGRVIDSSKAVINDDGLQLHIGDSLKEGQRVQLESGALEILLSTGAKLTLEGPVDLELSSLLRMELARGKVVAAVPRTARGYTIFTPTSELVDLGTQFGVSVADDGETELHVFDGDVVARSRAEKFSTGLVHAKENEGLRFDTAHSEPQRFIARASDFVRRLGPTISKDDLPPLPKTENLSLWYSADTIFNAKQGDSISIWRDVLAGDNQFANDARQLDAERCPTYLVDQRGLPAVHFNGWSTSLIVDPLEYLGSFTIFVVCTPGPTNFADHLHGGILFKHGDHPSLEFSILGDKKLQGWVWPGPGKPNVGVLRSEEFVNDSQISVAVYQYDSTKSRARIWLNGVMQTETDAPVELRPTAQAFLGSHHDKNVKANFFGSIYEVIVYDEYLNSDSMPPLHEYFNEKYQLKTGL